MCGIAGICSSGDGVNPTWLHTMTRSMKHRGPDDEGYLLVGAHSLATAGGADTPGGVWTGDFSYRPGKDVRTVGGRYRLCLGHRRLSIIDLSPRGHQPMCYRDGNVWVVFNGEIYNHIELRDELKSLGYRFRSQTDTEVLLAAYDRWDEDCLDRFDGMWAFVVFDREKNRLFGARDRFGVKPLYYYFDNAYFSFGSEIKALVRLPFVQKTLNPGAVFDYLSLGREDQEGFFQHVHSLEPSHAFRYDLEGHTLKIWKFYELRYADHWESVTEARLADYRSALTELVFDSVKARIQSDVPVGSCLSGGLDSSAVVCFIHELMKRGPIAQLGKQQDVFTACYDDPRIDESRWAGLVAAHAGASWHRVYPRADELIRDVEDLVYTQDIPFGSSSIYAQYRVMKLAREEGVTVLLDGQGGDELFTGYIDYYKVFLYELLRTGRLERFVTELSRLNNSPVSRRDGLLSLARLMVRKVSPRGWRDVLARKAANRSSLLNESFREAHQGRIVSSSEADRSSVNALCADLMGGRLKTLLRYEDRNSMRFSIEARTPFADTRNLVEFVFGIPGSYKILRGWSKFLLREAASGIVPEPVVSRRDKIGFSTPEHRWLMETGEALTDYMTEDLNEYIQVQSLKESFVPRIQKGSKKSARYLWRLVNFAVWKKVFQL